MKTLLVIGGSGFFGKSILDSFKRGQLDQWGVTKVIAMARNADRLRAEAPDLIDQRVELLNADISNITWLPNADYVIHAAASTDAKSYIERPEMEKRNILASVYNYCQLAPAYHSSSKILYVSSGAVYGVQPDGMDSLTETYIPKNESDIPCGKRDYTLAKRDAESVVAGLGTIGMNITIARCFTFVGRFLPKDQHFAIGNFIKNGQNGKPIKVNASHRVYRSYMFADDLVVWLMTLVDSASPKCEIFNVGSDHALSLHELASEIAKIFDTTVDVPDLDNPRIDRYVPSIQKAKEILGLKIMTDVQSAIRLSID